MDSPLRTATVGQIAINCKDVERATAFYRDVLGLPYLFSIPSGSFFMAGDVRLFVDKAESAEFDHMSSVVYFKVDDIQATTEALRARGVTIREEPHLLAKMPDHDLWMAFFDDSEGNVMSLMSEVRQA
jgi:methylmalonyl-CoA/ethylmalonyl-CoA epimerase